jgi:hypothetical protein
LLQLVITGGRSRTIVHFINGTWPTLGTVTKWCRERDNNIL